ncbi:hypothetical protein QFC22_003370 [Naganishia vaughanmartiniae]|uniref:Uncharacterized protein n=1 Tax=Naganishia vaughanmartiniae TaxID=1424756 RepID=A0ACC2X7T9_9TREE|nr:hypothetical protein QFC22_003370 [Naganishia vaughanmartiniae]
MSDDQSQHVVQIPHAVSIAASVDPNTPTELRQQAVEYLQKVKELSDQTWKACLTLYLQGAGATGVNAVGRDGKEKLSSELRVYCLQVVDDMLGNRPELLSEQDLVSLQQAMMQYVQTEFVEGSAEMGMAFLRNKFCYTLTLVFLRVYPSPSSDFLKPFLSFLNVPQSSAQANQLQTTLLTLHLLCEIASEVHDPLLKSARSFAGDRNRRDGMVRDSLRATGDTKAVIEGALGLVERGMNATGQPMLEEAVEWALRTLGAWAPWVDITTSVTPESLNLYQQLVNHASPVYRSAALSIYNTLLAKGTKTPPEKVQVMSVLNVMAFIPSLEENSRSNGKSRSNEEERFRESLAKLLSSQGVEAIKVYEDTRTDDATRAEAEKLWYQTLPYLIKFLEDSSEEVAASASPLLNDTMRLYKKARKANENSFQLPQDKVEFFRTLLQTQVKQMQWGDDMPWGLGGADSEVDEEDLETFIEKRKRLKNDLDGVANIDPTLFNTMIVGFILDIYNTIQTQGFAAVPWQRAELAGYLTFIYGELQKSGLGKEAFFDIPIEVQNAVRDRNKERNDAFRNRAMALKKGESAEHVEIKQYETIDFAQFPLKPLGQILLKAIESQALSFPHSAVTLQVLECCSRYYEFFKCKTVLIQPVLEAFVDARGIHNPDEDVRNRVFYLFAKFVRELKNCIEPSFVPAILNSIGDALPIVAVLPEVENPGDDVLTKAITGSQPFDNHLHLFEAVGSLIHLVKDQNEQAQLLQAVIAPLLQDLEKAIQTLRNGAAPEPLVILQVHHVISAVGSIASGFPDAPEFQPATPPNWEPIYQRAIEAVLNTLQAFKGHRIVRDASRNAFSGIIKTMTTRATKYMPTLVVNMVGEFDAQELVEFLSFLGMLAHKLNTDIQDIMDQLLPVLFDRVYLILGQPANGTDDVLVQAELRKAYLTFLTTIFQAGLHQILLSPINKPRFESFISSLVALGTTMTDRTDRTAQRGALQVIRLTVSAWATDPAVVHGPSMFLTDIASKEAYGKDKLKANGQNSNGSTPSVEINTQVLPGYQQTVYDRLVPEVFNMVMSPEFNTKDGQSQLILHEVSNLLRDILMARGQEGIDFLLTFLTSKQCPLPAAQELVRRMRSEILRDFRKTFSDFIKDWKAAYGLS